MIKLAAGLLALTLTLVLGSPGAEAQSACDYYRVQKGDSLRDLAETVYGDRNYRRIWAANRDVLGRDPNVISVGVVLKLPCLDGAMPAGAPPAPAPAPALGTGTGTAFTFVTAGGFGPYAGEALPGQGLIPALVGRAMARGGAPVEIAFVNDRAAHLKWLLPRQAFDASFPWLRPACDAPGGLTKAEAEACARLLYSDPLFESVEGIFARPGSGYAALTEAAGLDGARLCRPQGHGTAPLAALGLDRDALTLTRPARAERCFTLLMDGKVDAVAYETRAGAALIAALGLQHKVVENPHITHIVPLRLALDRDHPEAAAILQALHAGLDEMLRSGEWDSLLRDGLRGGDGGGGLMN